MLIYNTYIDMLYIYMSTCWFTKQCWYFFRWYFFLIWWSFFHCMLLCHRILMHKKLHIDTGTTSLYGDTFSILILLFHCMMCLHDNTSSYNGSKVVKLLILAINYSQVFPFIHQYHFRILYWLHNVYGSRH